MLKSLPAFVILFILYGLTYAIIVGVQRALVSDLAPEDLKATSLGIFQAILGLCAILSGIIAGILFDINNNFVFIYGFSLSFISVLLLIVLSKKIESKNFKK